MTASTERLHTETAHVLFTDLVGFSRGLLEEQVRRKHDLVTIVQSAPEFLRAAKSARVLMLDTGDGVILVFFGDPTSPLRCALEIASALREHPDLPLRMGIHSGMVARDQDVNGNPTVTGEGVNLGERVMSSGDGGHILLSEDSAKQLLSSLEWQGNLHRLGPYTVKHGVVMVLYSFHDEVVGNPIPPSHSPTAEMPLHATLKPVAPAEEAPAIGGAVRLGSQLYVERPTDAAFLRAIRQRDSIALIKGARQMGKSSLLARGLQQAREAGAKVVWTDFQEFSASTLSSAESLLKEITRQLAEELDLPVSPDTFWNSNRDANANLRRYLSSHVLSAFPEPLVWGMDEVDRLFDHPYASDFFSLIRVLHNRRSSHPGEPWARLTCAIAHSTEPGLFILDQTASPFNVGTRLTLEDFTPEQAAELNQRYGKPLRKKGEEERLYALVSGHPFLTSKAFYEISENGLSLEELEAHADQDTGPFGEHLRGRWTSLSRNDALTQIVRGMLQDEPCADEQGFYRLRSAGILVGETARDARLRCRLYATYLRQRLS